MELLLAAAQEGAVVVNYCVEAGIGCRVVVADRGIGVWRWTMDIFFPDCKQKDKGFFFNQF